MSSNKNWGPKPFKFINRVEGWMAHIVKENLKYVKEKLKVWNREVYGMRDLNIEEIVKDMKLMEEEGADEAKWDGERWKGLNSEFWAALQQKEDLLAQKASVNWIQQGVGNTKFFHNTVKLRQRRNQIEQLKIEDRWISEVEKIKG